MKTRNLFLIPLAVLIFMFFETCKKNTNSPDNNLSSISTIQLGTASAGTPYYTLDNTGKYLFLFVRDLNYNNGLVLKINLSASTPFLEKTITIPGTVPISPDNIVVTDDNQFISTFFYFGNPSLGLKQAQLIYKFDINLNITKIDTVFKSAGGNFGRTRLVKNGNGKITGVFSNKIGSRCYLTYKNMDENLNILNSKTDSATLYGVTNITGTYCIKTSDGGYLYAADNTDTPYTTTIHMHLEKRDANFNLLWTARYKSSPPNWASSATLNEYKGKYYVNCANTITPQSAQSSIFVLVYDLNGNLIQNTPLPVDGIVFRDGLTTGPMRKTDNGEFLFVASTKLNIAPNQQRGILYHLDANINVLSSEIYGGKGVVGSLIKISSNKYLHFYLDNNFTTDNNLPRLVFRYIDAKGVIIK